MALSRDWHCKKIDYSLLTYGLTSDWKPSQWHHALTSAECLFYVITLYIGIHRVSRYTLQTGYWTSVTHQELLQLTKPFLIRLTTAVTLTDWCLMSSQLECCIDPHYQLILQAKELSRIGEREHFSKCLSSSSSCQSSSLLVVFNFPHYHSFSTIATVSDKIFKKLLISWDYRKLKLNWSFLINSRKFLFEPIVLSKPYFYRKHWFKAFYVGLFLTFIKTPSSLYSRSCWMRKARRCGGERGDQITRAPRNWDWLISSIVPEH